MYDQAGITLNGMYHYFNLITENEEGEPLFNNISLYPGGTVYSNDHETGYEIPPMYKDLLIDEILENHGELLCVRQNPFRFKKMVENFFETNYHNFERIWIALWMDYNPIDNYDRHEYHDNEYNSDHTRTDKQGYRDTTTFIPVGTETDIFTPEGVEKVETKPVGTSKETVEEKVSADNSSDYQPERKTETTPVTTQTETSFGTSGTARKDTTTHQFGSDRIDTTTFEHQYLDGEDKTKHGGNDYLTIWAHGNIGVAKTSEIIADEIKLRAFNFYEYVADLFESKLLLQIY